MLAGLERLAMDSRTDRSIESKVCLGSRAKVRVQDRSVSTSGCGLMLNRGRISYCVVLNNRVTLDVSFHWHTGTYEHYLSIITARFDYCTS
jgi:hypothetical protein